MAEHRMDTSVLQAMLADTWQQGYDARGDDQDGWYKPNPYWQTQGGVTEEDLKKINDFIAGSAEPVWIALHTTDPRKEAL